MYYTKTDINIIAAPTPNRLHGEPLSAHQCTRPVVGLRRYAGGTFVGYTAAGVSVALATIVETPSLKWQLLNVSSHASVVSVRYNSPDGGFGNMAEIEVYERK